MDSLVEVVRCYCEERERLEDAIVQELVCRKHSKKHEINSGHMVRELMDRHRKLSLKILEMFEDSDGTLKLETESLCGPNEFAEFYGKLRAIKEHHRRFSTENSTLDAMTMEFQKMTEERSKDVEDDNLIVKFTDEEGFGRYLDLHEHYTSFLNLPNNNNNNIHNNGCKPLSYLKYLENYDKLYKMDENVRESIDYRDNYLMPLHNYLIDFVRRAIPLLNIEMELAKAEHIFELNAENNSLPGINIESYKSSSSSSSATAHTNSNQQTGLTCQIDLGAHNDAEELISYGMDNLKNALKSMGLKCGGTLKERAERLFSVKGKTFDELPSNIKQKSSSNSTKLIRRGHPTKEYILDVAKIEAKIYHLGYLLHANRVETIENVERKQSRTVDELLNEEDDEAVNIENDITATDDHNFANDDDQDQAIYNPKNLPLDIDGKPIPYWLYKLHGLNLYYDCEICGNTKYRGPKAFQRHFSEWRHAHGMRCLGIPNTPHFHNVTKIDDAVALWNKIKQDRQVERWDADNEEEFEDSTGNVVNRKVYEDLRKQGLL